MIPTKKWLMKSGNKHPLAYRLLYHILLFSSFFTLLATGGQLLLDYLQGVNLIEKQMRQIQESYLQSITQSVWNMDEQQMDALLTGILQLQDIEYVEYHEGTTGKNVLKKNMGTVQQEQTIIRSFPLVYLDKFGKHSLGSLYVVASLKGVYQRLAEKVLIILISQGIKTFMVSLFILFIVQYLITRHLQTMADYTTNLNINQLSSPLRLNRGDSTKSKNDELGRVVIAINEMRENLFRDITRRIAAEQQVKELNENLEKKVQERTRELHQKNNALNKTLVELKDTQEQLVQTEKVAALGKLVANIAHEINTPLGAIRSSAENLLLLFNKTVEEAPEFFRGLSKERLNDYFTLLKQSIAQTERPSMKEQRKLKKKLRENLEPHFPEQARDLAGELVQIRLYDEVQPFFPLFQSRECPSILDKIYQRISQLQGLENIVKASERVSKVVFALKTFSRLDHNHEFKKENIIEGIEAALTLYQHQLSKGITVVRDYSELPKFPCFMDELNQVWINLIHNALQAMEGSGTLTIIAKMYENTIRVTINDTGGGIPVEIQDKIFSPFFTTRSMGEGSGLGLDICRKMIEKYKGTINFQSEPGKTEFIVELPIT